MRNYQVFLMPPLPKFVKLYLCSTVSTQEQYDRIAVLAQDIKGDRLLNIKTKVASAQMNKSQGIL
jgi:hypothetical protein